MRVSKLETEIPNLSTNYLVYERLGNSKSGSTITREEGLAPSQRPFENDTNYTHVIF